MSQSQFSIFYVIVCIVLCLLLAYVEVAWLRRTLQLALIGKSVAAIGIVNLFFYFVLWSFMHGYYGGPYFVFPFPVVQVFYFFVKVMLYFMIRRYSGSDIHSPWLTAFLTIPLHLGLGALVLAGANVINPTNENIDNAIRERANTRFSVQLALSYVREPYLSEHVDVAVTADNLYALKKLLGAGNAKDLSQSQYGTRESTLMIAKWRLAGGVKIDEIKSIDVISLFSTPGELTFFINAGLDPGKYPTMIHAALSNRSQAADTLSRDESRQLIEKLQILLDHGVLIGTPDENGLSSLFTALRCNEHFPEVVEFLLAKGADPNFRSTHEMYSNDFGEIPKTATPLMLAAALKDTDHVKVLLAHGAQKELKDDKGRTAFDYAVKVSAGDDLKNLLK